MRGVLHMKKIFIVPFLAIVLGLGFCMGYGVVYAHIIPGWDEPWDPPNYYSNETISWADTNNPSYFYRDLGWQGGSVYDAKRDVQSGYEKAHFLDWLKQEVQILALQIINMTPWNGDVLAGTILHINNRQGLTEEINALNGDNVLQSEILRDFTEGKANSAYNEKSKLELAQSAYAAYANTAKTSLSDTEEVDGKIVELLDEAAAAEGDMQIEQVQGELSAMQEQATARRNALLAKLTELKAIEQKLKNDEDLAYFRQVQNAQLQVRDPYHETDRERQEYQRPEGRGFVPFK